jgi:hypothetical protein
VFRIVSNEGRRLAFLWISCFIQNHWVSVLRPSSGVLNTRKYNGSGTGSVSVLRWGEGDAYSVGSLNHWVQIYCFIVSLSVFPFPYTLYWANHLPNHHIQVLLSLQVASRFTWRCDRKEWTAGVSFWLWQVTSTLHDHDDSGAHPVLYLVWTDAISAVVRRLGH